MKIAFDLDGTFFAYPDLFTEIGKGLQKRGHKVGIVTGHEAHQSKKDDEKRLERYGFTPDFYIGEPAGTETRSARAWKPAICRQYDIDYLFDDFRTMRKVELWPPVNGDRSGDA